MSLQAFLFDVDDPDAYNRTSTKVLLKKKNHGWCTRMFQLRWMCVVFPCRCRRCRVAVACLVYRRSMYLRLPTPSPLSSSFTHSSLFLLFSCRAWCGADGDRVFFFFLYIAYISTRHNQKIHCSKNCMVVCIVTPSVLMSAVVSWTPGRKLPQGGHTHLVNAFSHYRLDGCRLRELLS